MWIWLWILSEEIRMIPKCQRQSEELAEKRRRDLVAAFVYFKERLFI
jgi:hypothetical protein